MEERPKRRRPNPDSNDPSTTGKAKTRPSAGGPSAARSPQRKQAEAVLKESEAKYRALAEEFRALLDAIPDMVYFKDTEGRHRFVNQAFERIMGTSQDAVAGKTYEDLMPPELAACCRRSDGAVFAAGNVVRSEEEMPGPGGTPISLETIKAPLFDERGEIAGLVGLTRDITARKEAEAALKVQEALLRHVLETLPVGVWIVGGEGRIVLGNEEARRVWGGARYVGIEGYGEYKGWWAGSGKRIEPEEWASTRAVTRGETSLNEEIEIEGFDGIRRFILHSAVPIRDEGGKVTGAIVVNQDITERKRIEKAQRRSHEELEERVRERTAALTEANAALRETTRTLEELIHASPVGIAALDPEGKTTLWNPAMEKIYGWTEDEARGRLPPPVTTEQEGAKAILERLLAGERFAGVELRRVRKDGRPVDLSLWTAPLREASGRLKSTVVIFLDVTHLKEMERMALLQQKMASLGQVAAGIAHEIRNPLSGINISISSIRNACARSEGLEPELREKIRLIMEQMTSAAGKMRMVVQRVMDFSRPAPPKMVPLCLNRCIEEALQLSQVTLRKDDIRLSKALSGGLPQVKGDARLLVQVLLNLFSNASQALEGHGGEKTVEVASFRENGYVHLSVGDSGPGVPLHLREKIFEPFYTTTKEGTGIGLAICHRIISGHGGFIQVGESRLGGALFTIGLPLREERSAPEF